MSYKTYRTFRGRKLRLSGGVQFRDFVFEAKNGIDEQIVETSELFRHGHIIVVPDSKPAPTPPPVDDVVTIAETLAKDLSAMKKDELQAQVTEAGLEPEGTLKADLVRTLVLHATGYDIAPPDESSDDE